MPYQSGGVLRGGNGANALKNCDAGSSGFDSRRSHLTKLFLTRRKP